MIHLLIALVATAQAYTTTKFLDLGEGCRVRSVVASPAIPVVADVLFLTGFADRADNHGPLFDQLNAAGYRVISFDYPGHGESECGSFAAQNISSLGRLAVGVTAQTLEDANRPLYVSGWSTGGLIAMRLLQKHQLPDRKVAGLVMIAPGLAINPLPGDWGWVTQESLLSNPHPPHKGPIQPVSPVPFVKFAGSLIVNGIAARNGAIPDIPILIFLGGIEADAYADTRTMRRWIRLTSLRHGNVQAIQCPEGKHELDNEIEPMGGEVREAFVEFLRAPDSVALFQGNACANLR